MGAFHQLVLVFLCLFLINLVTPVYAQDPPLPTPVGRVVWVKGTLKAVAPNKEERSLVKTSVIYLHDTLSTDAQSQAQIVFTDNTLMTFREGTKFTIDQYTYKPNAKKKGSVGKYIMNLIEGGFRTITGIIAESNPSDYQINTPVATIGVRGTDYTVFARGTEVYVGYYSGKPCVTGKVGGELCLSATTPYARVPSAVSPPIPMTQTPEVFKTKLEIVPAKIEPFTSPVAQQRPAPAPAPAPGRGGPINSFCITQ